MNLNIELTNVNNVHIQNRNIFKTNTLLDMYTRVHIE